MKQSIIKSFFASDNLEILLANSKLCSGPIFKSFAFIDYIS